MMWYITVGGVAVTEGDGSTVAVIVLMVRIQFFLFKVKIKKHACVGLYPLSKSICCACLSK